jgi:hypothetical protein
MKSREIAKIRDRGRGWADEILQLYRHRETCGIKCIEERENETHTHTHHLTGCASGQNPFLLLERQHLQENHRKEEHQH